VCDFENGKAHEGYLVENGKFVVVNSRFIASSGRVKRFTNQSLSPLKIGDVVMVMSP
jgi:type I restriction enzyme S subunit